jgi:hypothetical protein
MHTEYLNDTKQTMIEAIVLADLSVDPNKDKEQALKDHLNNLFTEDSKKIYSGSRIEKLIQFKENMKLAKDKYLKELR